jgi:chorismate mutase/prephenate dehydratase
MAKRKSKASEKPHTTAQLKRQLAKLDKELLGNLHQHAELVRQIAAQLSEAGKPLDGELTDVEALVATSQGPLPARALAAVFRELLSGSRQLARLDRVAYLGPEYSYTHIAAIHRFGQSADLVPVATIAAIFSEVHSQRSEFGLVPIENSTDGRIADTLHRFANVPVEICGEVQLPIHHNLLAKCSRADVKEVHSKPQALSQCRDWLATHMPNATLHEATSTTAAAALAAKTPGIAAVASRQAGIACGLDVIAKAIEDNPNNVTRFAVIGQQQAARSGDDKTSLMYQINHEPGALADSMTIFKRNRLNLTWIESFPIPELPSEYLFFVELEGHPKDLRVRRAIASLEKKTVRLDVLGAYAKTKPVEE